MLGLTLLMLGLTLLLPWPGTGGEALALNWPGRSTPPAGESVGISSAQRLQEVEIGRAHV